MSNPENAVENILRTAIQREIDAHALYSSTADAVESPVAKEVLGDLAAQELGHRRRLESLLARGASGALPTLRAREVEDLKITDYLVEVPLAPDSSVQDILIVAGKREKASHDLYASLAKFAGDSDTTKLFEFLVQEELSHKQRIESLYEEIVYQEN